jgi:23S rRNA (guanosine2251-2'-O)-methyltransferase
MMMASTTFSPSSRKGRKTAKSSNSRSAFGDKKPTFGGFKPTKSGDASPASRYGKKPFNKVASPYQAEDRPERSSYGDRKPAYGQRSGESRYTPRTEGERSERPAYGDRKPAYGERSDRPAYGDRKPAYGGERAERPSYGDRKPAYGGERSDRPSYGDRKPAYGQRPERKYTPRVEEGGSFVAGLVNSEAFSAEAKKLEQATQIHEKLAEGGAYTLYGKHAVLEVLQSNTNRVQKVLIMEDAKPDKRINSITQLCESAGIYWQLVPKAKLDTMMTYLADATTHLEDGVETGHHQGVIAIVTAQPLLSVEELLDTIAATPNQPCLIFALDEVTDPRNVGALLRVADAAGAKGMVIGKHRSAALNAVVSKTAAGADHWMPMAQATNLTHALELCKAAGFWIVGTACEGTGIDAKGYSTSVKPQHYATIDYNAPIVVVMGNEGEGLRPTILKHCDFLANIPMFGKVQSLNVSTAGAVLAFEIANQQQKHKQAANAVKPLGTTV